MRHILKSVDQYVILMVKHSLYGDNITKCIYLPGQLILRLCFNRITIRFLFSTPKISMWSFSVWKDVCSLRLILHQTRLVNLVQKNKLKIIFIIYLIDIGDVNPGIFFHINKYAWRKKKMSVLIADVFLL